MVIASEIIAWTALCGCSLSIFISLICVSSMSKILKNANRDDHQPLQVQHELFEKMVRPHDESKIPVEESLSVVELKLMSYINKNQDLL